MSSPAKPAVKTYQNYVNGQWTSSSTGATFPVFDPSTEEVIANVAAASASDVDKAVKAARAAFDSGPWPATTAQDRGRVLFKLAEKIRQNQRGGADYSLELPAADGGVEIGSCAGSWLHLRSEAGRTDAADGP
jgi:acyl-CoA reductase-like NAD-dependent aldehyde dehydrogenase